MWMKFAITCLFGSSCISYFRYIICLFAIMLMLYLDHDDRCMLELVDCHDRCMLGFVTW